MLQRSLYRSLLREVDKVHAHYGKDYARTSRVVFGSSIDPQFWLSFGPTPRHAIRHYFRAGLPAGAAARGKSVAVFETLKRLNAAIGNAEEDAKLLQTVSLRRAEIVFDVPCYNSDFKAPNRITIHGDPFWAMQLCHSPVQFPWKTEFAWCADSDIGPLTTTTATTHSVQISCTTRELRQVVTPTHTHNIFEYKIKIKNIGKKGSPSIQVLSRHWYFLDMEQGTVVEVCGKGIAGLFPMLRPGEEHSYSSGTDLHSHHGVMKGMFQVARFHTVLEGEKDSSSTSGSTDGEPGAFIDMVDVVIAPTLLKA